MEAENLNVSEGRQKSPQYSCRSWRFFSQLPNLEMPVCKSKKYTICSHRKHMLTHEKYIHVFLRVHKHEQAPTQTHTQTCAQQGEGDKSGRLS